ncbi:hypothetical protein [Saccharibacillus deserti]|uniref:hypothetical protein n=1 Tax=Saccharibacillus deserti TaxID=1634444 RepID=UPI00155267CE|nr:hypothetical protein [Saccharibacillus deserti]
MRQVLKAILASKKIFSMLFIGFLLTVLPILVALSTQRYYDEHFYHSKNGHIQNYYSVTLKNAEEADLSDIQNKAKAFLKKPAYSLKI